MIFARVFEDLPRLNLLLGDSGGAFPNVLRRLDHGHRVRKECAALVPEAPSSYARQLYVDTAAMDAPALRCTVDLLGSKQVLFASAGDDCVEARQRLTSMLQQVGADEERAICGDNASRLFKLGGTAC
jgi:predicted TIM-barrel fold metal-dependent hydrolase